MINRSKDIERHLRLENSVGQLLTLLALVIDLVDLPLPFLLVMLVLLVQLTSIFGPFLLLFLQEEINIEQLLGLRDVSSGCAYLLIQKLDLLLNLVTLSLLLYFFFR